MHNFDELITFVRIVEASSLTLAARRLLVTKSMVSRRLSSLEDRLKVRLVTRVRRGVVPTELGRACYDQCVRILADLDGATAGVTGLNGRAWGTVRVAAPLTFGRLHLMPVLAEVLEANPDLTVEVDLSDRVVDIAGEGFDLAVRIGIWKDSSLIARRLAPVRRVLCASPTYLTARGSPEEPGDLHGHECLAYGNAPASEVWRFVTGSLKRPPQVRRLSANDDEMLRDAAVRGLGIAALPTFIAGPAVERGEFTALMRDHPLEELGLYAVYPPQPAPDPQGAAAGGRPGEPFWAGAPLGQGMRDLLRRGGEGGLRRHAPPAAAPPR